jgi:hypothetical protein
MEVGEYRALRARECDAQVLRQRDRLDVEGVLWIESAIAVWALLDTSSVSGYYDLSGIKYRNKRRHVRDAIAEEPPRPIYRMQPLPLFIIVANKDMLATGVLIVQIAVRAAKHRRARCLLSPPVCCPKGISKTIVPTETPC